MGLSVRVGLSVWDSVYFRENGSRDSQAHLENIASDMVGRVAILFDIFLHHLYCSICYQFSYEKAHLLIGLPLLNRKHHQRSFISNQSPISSPRRP